MAAKRNNSDIMNEWMWNAHHELHFDFSKLWLLGQEQSRGLAATGLDPAIHQMLEMVTTTKSNLSIYNVLLYVSLF